MTNSFEDRRDRHSVLPEKQHDRKRGSIVKAEKKKATKILINI